MTDLARLGFEGDEEVLVARISGEIDLSNVFDLRDKLVGALPNAAVGLVLDLADVRYLDSSGVRLVIELGNRGRWRQQQIRLVVPESSPIRRVLSLTGVEHVVPLDRTIEESRSQIAAG